MNIGIAIIIMILLITITQNIYASSFEEKFEWVKQTFEENDAGVPHILERRGQAAYEVHNRMILERIRAAESIQECAEILWDWMRFFRSNHLGLTIIIPEPTSQEDEADVTNIHPIWHGDIAQFKEYISRKEIVGFEGIWDIGGAYTVGIIREGDRYTGFTIDSIFAQWLPNMVKLMINKEGEEVVSTFYLLNFSPDISGEPVLYGNNLLQLGRFFMKRIYPELPNDPQFDFYTRIMSGTEFFIERLNTSTLYIRIPSFLFRYGEVISNLINENHSEIIQTQNLIIDLRDNRGGDGRNTDYLIPILYTNPIVYHISEIRSSPLSLELHYKLSQGINPRSGEIDTTDEDLLRMRREMYEQLKANEGGFTRFHDDATFIVGHERVYQYPKNVGVIIDRGSVSASEYFLLAAKQSNKVKLFGVPTEGAVDTGFRNSIDSPCGELRLDFWMTRSTRLPALVLDGIGIQPDFFIDSSIPNYRWVEHVTEIMNSWVTEPEKRRRRGRR